MNDKPFLMNLTREVVIDYWKNITGREKESFSLMFRAADVKRVGVLFAPSMSRETGIQKN
ncbi:hypothetical protein DAPK24_019710 [Pichia kluyveri]|uniref:Uncharacterized protein n=1 Tax=Pichia kluyveri TaxID=36015 RepID=A0AAV5R2A5_PICKL|nr:hypothetical protein DAPK24_019710 [Pichia kluyveri]